MTRLLLALTAALLLAGLAGSQTAHADGHNTIEQPVAYDNFKPWRITWKQRTNRVRDNRCYKPLHFRARAWEVPARRRGWVLHEWSKKPDRNRARDSRCLPTSPAGIIRYVWPNSTQETAVRVAWCESRLYTYAFHPATNVAGLFQIDDGWYATSNNYLGHRFNPYNAWANTRQALWLYRDDGNSFGWHWLASIGCWS